MDNWLLIAGLLFLVIGLALLVAGVVMMMKRRQGNVGAAGAPPAPPPRAAAPQVLPQAAPSPVATPPAAAPPAPAAEPGAGAGASVAGREAAAASEAPEARPEVPPPATPPHGDPLAASVPPEEEATVAVSGAALAPYGTLVGVSGPLAGRVLPIDERGFFVGRDASVSQVVIEDGRISKRHVWIGVRDGKVIAVDQGSTNGTYINSRAQRIGEAVLAPGDVVILADDAARLRYEK